MLLKAGVTVFGFKDAFGYFPPKEELVRLAIMSKEELATDGLYLTMAGLVRGERERKLADAPFVPLWALNALEDILREGRPPVSVAFALGAVLDAEGAPFGVAVVFLRLRKLVLPYPTFKQLH